MSKKGHVPIRTCIGCREKKKKEEMIWLAGSPAGVVVNGKKPHQGRGFYLCPDVRCLNRAKKRRKGVELLETMEFGFPSAKGLRHGR